VTADSERRCPIIELRGVTKIYGMGDAAVHAPSGVEPVRTS
jgi:hypothetical protein